MRLTFNQGSFIFSCTFNEKQIAKDAGCRWDPDGTKNKAKLIKVWWTDDETVALKLAKYADDSCKEKLQQLKEQRAQAVQLSRAQDADIDIPANEGITYKPFQKAGVKRALQIFESGKGVLLGDQMRLGKTPQSLAVINCLAEIKNVIAFVPSTIKLNWKREAERFLTRRFNYYICGGTHPSAYIVTAMREPRFLIINYDIAHAWKVVLMQRTWDLIICDEAHRLKSRKARRTLSIIGGSYKEDGRVVKVEPIPRKRLMHLTGTPMPNKTEELWPLIHSLDPQTWPSRYKFEEDYCSYYGGNGSLLRLQEILRSTIMIRRTQKEVFKELPPKLRQVIPLDSSDFSDLIIGEMQAYEEKEEEIEQLRANVELAKASESEEDYRNACKALRDQVSVAFEEMSRLRHQTAVAKIPAVIDHLKMCFDGGSDKIVVWAHHRDVIEAIAEEWGDEAVIMYGGMDSEAKDAAIRKFQIDSSCILFVGSVSIAEGFSLAPATHEVFAELSWVPKDVNQAEDRCVTAETKVSILVQHLVIDGSMDAKMAHKLVAKQEVIDKAMDEISAVEAEDPVIIGEAAATETTSRKQLEKEAFGLSPEAQRAVHAGLRILSDMCDGAREVDGAGFNKIDTFIGKSLAQAIALTPKQCILGRKILTKYARQLPLDILEAMRK